MAAAEKALKGAAAATEKAAEIIIAAAAEKAGVKSGGSGGGGFRSGHDKNTHLDNCTLIKSHIRTDCSQYHQASDLFVHVFFWLVINSSTPIQNVG